MQKQKHRSLKPKQYTNIDYEALLIYSMKRRISIEQVIKTNNLTIARSTVIRNIEKMKGNPVIDFYKNQYVKNYQKLEMPKRIKEVIDLFQERPIVIKRELDDVYNKLYIMNEIVEQSGGNFAEATRRINSGQTPLGSKSISRQGLEKNIKYFKEVKKSMEDKMKENEEQKGEEK